MPRYCQILSFFLSAVLILPLAGCMAEKNVREEIAEEAPEIPVGELSALPARFFSALAAGDLDSAQLLYGAELPLTPLSESGGETARAVRESWRWTAGTVDVDGEKAVCTGTLSCLDTGMLLDRLESDTAVLLAEATEAARRAEEVYNEKGWLPETLENAKDEALEPLLDRPEEFVTTRQLTVSLRSSESGWVIEPSPELTELLQEGEAQLLSQAVKARLSVLPVIQKIYRLSPDTTVAPVPDEEGYGVAESAEEITALFEREEARRLLNGQQSAWSRVTELSEASILRYYLDESILAVIWQERRIPSTITFCEIILGDGSQLFRKLTGDAYNANYYEVPSALARQANAVVAMDADFYRARNYGVNIYQGQLFRWAGSAVDSCFFTAGGDMLFARAGEITTQEEAQMFLEENDIVTGIAFGPIMVEDGANVTPPLYPDGCISEGYARCCLGQLGERHYLICAVDYWATVSDVADMLIARGVQRAYNVDGGQSSAIILGGEQVNPNIFGSEKPQSDILCFASAVPAD